MFWMVLYWIVVCFGRIRLVHQLDIRPQKRFPRTKVPFGSFWGGVVWRRRFTAVTEDSLLAHFHTVPTHLTLHLMRSNSDTGNRSPSVKVIIIILSPVAFLSTQVLLHQKIEPWYHLIYLFVRTVTSGLASKNLNPILETGKPKIPKLPITHSLDNMKRSGFHQLIWIGLIWFSSPYDLQHFSHQIKRMTGCLHVQIWNGFQEFGRHSHECIWWPRLGLR